MNPIGKLIRTANVAPMEPTTSYGASPQKVSQQQEAGPSRVSIVKDSIAAHSPRKNNTQEDEEGMIDSLSPPKAASDQNSRGPSENRANVVPSKPRENYCIVSKFLIFFVG